jgi:hypothetical protein
MKELNKTDVINYIEKKLVSGLDDLRKSYEQARHTMIESPGAMQSRYDTMGKEAAWLADGLAGRISDAEKDIHALRDLQVSGNGESIHICSLFTLANTKTGSKDTYFILPAGGGEEIDYDGYNILILTPQSPLSQSVLGKKKGDKAEFRNIEYIIEQVL